MARGPVGSNGSEDGLAKAIEIVMTPVVFAAAGFGLDRWWGTGPWLALSFGMTAFMMKLVVEWYRYTERMAVHEQEMAASRPSERRSIDRDTGLSEPTSLPTGVSLDAGADADSRSFRGTAETSQPVDSQTGHTATARPHS